MAIQKCSYWNCWLWKLFRNSNNWRRSRIWQMLWKLCTSWCCCCWFWQKRKSDQKSCQERRYCCLDGWLYRKRWNRRLSICIWFPRIWRPLCCSNSWPIYWKINHWGNLGGKKWKTHSCNERFGWRWIVMCNLWNCWCSRDRNWDGCRQSAH